MSWAENRKRLLIATLAFALIVAVITIAGLANSSATPQLEAGAPAIGNAEPTGVLKIIKAGNWSSDAFIFTWDCDNGVSGQANFSGDFTGANYTVSPELPLGTICTVEETDGSLSVSNYLVTTHTEAQAGFQAINPRDVSIDNSTGFNTIQFMNDPKDGEVWVTKEVIAPPNSDAAGATFAFAISCDPILPIDGQLGDGDSLHADVPAGAQCFASEALPGDQWLVTATLNGNPVSPASSAGRIGVVFDSSGMDDIVITNCYLGDIYFTECAPLIEPR